MSIEASPCEGHEKSIDKLEVARIRSLELQDQEISCWCVEVNNEITKATSKKVMDKADDIMVEIHPTIVLLYTLYCTKSKSLVVDGHGSAALQSRQPQSPLILNHVTTPNKVLIDFGPEYLY